MAVVALIALGAYIAASFGWRMWLQRRLTGDAGLRAAPRTRAEWVSGAGLVAGAIAVVLAPVLDLAGISEPIAALEGPLLRAVGITLFALGFYLTIRAQLDMGESWRIGVDLEESTALVTGGVFRFVRNPIFTGMLLVCAGSALMVPNALALAGAALIAGSLEIHVRSVEEPYLLGVHGERYASYARSAGRFMPRVGRLG